MPRDPAKGHAALRRGRITIPNAEYFLTVCTEERRPGLTLAGVTAAILGEMRAMDTDATWQLRCAVVMPDHIHLLVILGGRLSLGKSVARLKARISAVLRRGAGELQWERGFFDHHVHPEEDRLGLFLYLFLNPYRAGICQRRDPWPWFYCRKADWVWFHRLLDEDRPVPAWLES